MSPLPAALFDKSRLAVVRHFALSLVRSKDSKSIELRRKIAGWTQDYLEQVLNERVG